VPPSRSAATALSGPLIDRLLAADALSPVAAHPPRHRQHDGKYLGIRFGIRPHSTVSYAIRNGKVHMLDAGRANGQIFIQVVGVGFDANASTTSTAPPRPHQL